MAEGGERVHRVTGEAFHRLRNDHEQFLEAYEKPTQIYRFLKARQALKPLFLYRNLSYMPRRSRKPQRRFRKKLKVDDLLNHTTTRDAKTDLASEIKSDNHLSVSFCGIERGISFQNLIAGAVKADDDGTKESGESSNNSDKRPRHGQLMEVEILLFKFKQSSIHLSEGVYPYSCSSLGKQVLKYNDPSADDEDKTLLQQSSPGSTTGKNGEQGITLTIPESVLTWKGNRMPGTQMLVFRATYAKKAANKPKRMPLHLINFVSRKGCSKNVAVEVNRLNLTDIGQNKPKTKPLLRNNLGTNATTNGEFLLEGDETTRGGDGTSAHSLSSTSASCNRIPVDGADSLKTVLSSGQANNTHRQVMTNGIPVVNNCVTKKLPQTHSAQVEIVNSSLNPVASQSKRGAGLVKYRLLQKKKSKMKRVKIDASVMTEISFGTDTIMDMSTVSHTSSSCNDFYSNSDHPSTFISSPSESMDFVTNHTLSPPRTKQGFMDKCTSPKVLFRNGSFNGLNGYAVPEVAALRGNISGSRKSNGINPKVIPPSEITDGKCSGGGGGGGGGKLKHRKRHVERKKRLKCNYPTAGRGKRGMRSFLVSLPRKHYDNQYLGQQQHLNCLDSVDAASLQGESPGGKTYTSTYRRRSEVQLLLDGDKPPGQRLSPMEIPVFTAEDISNRSSRNVTTSASPWLESSTRKITPVEHYTYPLSPGKRTSFSSLIGNSSLPTSPSGLDAPSTSNDIFRKRGATSMEAISPVSPDHLPFTKRARVIRTPPRGFSENEKEEKKDMDTTSANTTSITTSSERSLEFDVLEELNKYNQKLTSNPVLLRASIPTSSPTPSLESRGVTDTTTLHHEEEVFNAELVVFDSRGECLIKDGEYSILMQSCLKERSGLSTFEPLTWATVFGGESDSEVGTKAESPNLLLKFTMHWLKGPPKHRLCTELDTALDLNKIREAYFLPRPTTLSPPLSSPPPPPPLTVFSLLPGKHKEPPPPSLAPDDETRAVATPSLEPNLTRGEDSNSLIKESLLPAVIPNQCPRNILFNFLYSNNSLQQTESRYGMICPWCNLSCGELYSLLKHMTLSHSRFHFTYTPNSDEKCMIDVHVNKMYNAGSSSFNRDPGEWSNISLVQRRSGPSKCLSCSAVLVERPADVKGDLSEFLNDGSWKRGYNTNRIYYHSRSCLPMVPEEIEAENDEELQTLEWQDLSSQKMIEEFTDVNHGEKELMKLWNIFSMEDKLIAEKQIPKACIKFAKENGRKIADKSITPNFLTHLISLFDYGLITPAVLKESMNIVYRLEATSMESIS